MNEYKPFEIVCLNKKFKFTNENFRPCNPFFYISIDEPDGYYSYETIFHSELIDVDADGEVPILGIYNPLKDRFVVATLWWYNDTYRGVIDMVGSKTSEWIYLRADYNNKIAKHSSHSYTINNEIFHINDDHSKRDVFYKLDDDTIKLVDELYDTIEEKDENSKKLKTLLCKLKVQRI